MQLKNFKSWVAKQWLSGSNYTDLSNGQDLLSQIIKDTSPIEVIEGIEAFLDDLKLLAKDGPMPGYTDRISQLGKLLLEQLCLKLGETPKG